MQQLRFVEFEQWFPPRRDERALEQFYTVLQEDFYNAYLNSCVAFISQRVCSLEAIVAVVGEQIRPHLNYLPGLADLLGWTSQYIPSWVRECSILPYGLTRGTGAFTLLSEAVTTGYRAQGLERY